MTITETSNTSLTNQQLGLFMQYTIEAYKTFQKYAEVLPNPMTAAKFKQFATDERQNRDLLEMKIASVPDSNVRATLGADLIFSEVLEGELGYREQAEFLISREKTMQRKLRELINVATVADRNIMIFIETVKRAHVVELESELELIRGDRDWWKREDAEARIVYGPEYE